MNQSRGRTETLSTPKTSATIRSVRQSPSKEIPGVIRVAAHSAAALINNRQMICIPTNHRDAETQRRHLSLPYAQVVLRTQCPASAGPGAISPIRRPIIFQKLSPHMRAHVESADDRIEDTCGAVHRVERRVKALFDDFACGSLDRVLVGD